MACSSDQSGFETHSASETDPQGPAEGVGQYVSELKEYAAWYASARWDGIKLSFRQAVISAALGVLCLCFVGAILAMSVVLLLNGIAGGLGALFGNNQWLGDLISGAILLSLLLVGYLLGIRWIRAKSRQNTVQKYESRKHRQSEKYGRDAPQRDN